MTTEIMIALACCCVVGVTTWAITAIYYRARIAELEDDMADMAFGDLVSNVTPERTPLWRMLSRDA